MRSMMVLRNASSSLILTRRSLYSLTDSFALLRSLMDASSFFSSVSVSVLCEMRSSLRLISLSMASTRSNGSDARSRRASSFRRSRAASAAASSSLIALRSSTAARKALVSSCIRCFESWLPCDTTLRASRLPSMASLISLTRAARRSAAPLSFSTCASSSFLSGFSRRWIRLVFSACGASVASAAGSISAAMIRGSFQS
mmetsp:Transcript_26830/g.88046  ORF Transcript_26830/g.88046 Transcript_26830/m.88046 type:complete len:200 (+) Transcript_26830:971-1570(+)